MREIYKGFDCATPVTNKIAKILNSQKMKFAGRYLVPARYQWKRLTRDEAIILDSWQIDIVSVFETYANRAASGYAAGVLDIRVAKQEAELIGQPAFSTIYFAVDYDAQTKDYPAIARYFEGLNSEKGIYNVGIYGSYSIINEIERLKLASHYWQTYAWSKGMKSKYANLFQYQNGVNISEHIIDLNEGYDNFGSWSLNKKLTALAVDLTNEYIACYIDGKMFDMLTVKGGVMLGPVRKLAEKIGYQVNWQPGRVDLISPDKQRTAE